MDIIKYVILMLMAASFRNGMNTDVIPQELQQQYIQEYVFEIIEENGYDVHPALILSIIEVESRYCWQAKNGVHVGLMQINPNYQQDRMDRLGVEDIVSNPYDNILVGTDMMCELLDKYGNEYDALNAYNSGSTDGYAHEYSIEVMDRYRELEHEMWDTMEGW